MSGHSALRAGARAARSALLDEAAALVLDLVGSPLRDGEAAQLLQLVDSTPSALYAALSGDSHE